MIEKKYTWYKIAVTADEFDWQNNNMLVTDTDGKKITIAKYKDKLFACPHQCPHAGGILADGFVDAAGNIVCPVHHYKFNLQNGRNTSGEGYFLKIFLTEMRNDGIYIGFEEKDLFSNSL